MLSDIVVDTNVLMHSRNSVADIVSDPHGFLRGASEFVCAFENCHTKLCVDDAGQILGEYMGKMVPGKAGASILAKLALTKRIRRVHGQLNQTHRKHANTMNIVARDRTFLAVAVHSDEKLLVSHDMNHFLRHKQDIRTRFQVAVLKACECLHRLP